MILSDSKVCSYLKLRTNIDPSSIDYDTSLIKTGTLDSLQLIELIIWLEKETNAPVEMDNLLTDNDITIQAIVNYLNAYQLK